MTAMIDTRADDMAVDPTGDDREEGAFDFEGSGVPSTPESGLWAAVLERVWRDAFIDGDDLLGASAPTPEGRIETADAVRSEARRWLTANIDPWREDRETICDFLGLNPAALRIAAMRAVQSLESRDAQFSASMLRALEFREKSIRAPRFAVLLNMIADIESNAA